MNTPRTAEQALEPTADPAWVLHQQGFDSLRDSSRESRFAISNGFLGVRGGRTIDRLPKAAVIPRTYVAGLFDSIGSDQPLSALVPAPDWLRIEISLASQGASAAKDDISFHSRTLDFRRGVLVTESRVENSPNLEMRLRVLRLVSLHSRTLGLQVIQLDIVAGTVEATLEASFEGLEFGLAAERLEQSLGVWRTNTTGKRLAMAAAATLRVGGRVVAAKTLGPLKWSWTWTTRPGQVVQFERVVAVALGDAGTANTVEQAQDHLAAAEALGWAGILGRHEASWADRWRASEIVVHGDPAAQHALRFALYHLNGAANPRDGVWLGIHFPDDMLASAFIGGASGALAHVGRPAKTLGRSRFWNGPMRAPCRYCVCRQPWSHDGDACERGWWPSCAIGRSCSPQVARVVMQNG